MTRRCKVEFRAGIVLVIRESRSLGRVCAFGRVTREAGDRRTQVACVIDQADLAFQRGF